MRLNEFTRRIFEGKYDGGDCYENAAELVLANKEYTLVHGVVTGQGGLEGMQYGHAWVEYDGDVIDNANGRNLRFPAAVYYHLGKIDPAQQHKYNSAEIREMLMQYEHWGPWEEDVSPEVLI